MVVLCDDVPSTISTFDVAGECVMLMCEPFTPAGAEEVVLLWIWLVFTVLLLLPSITVFEVISPSFTLLSPLIVLFDTDCVDTTVLFPPSA